MFKGKNKKDSTKISESHFFDYADIYDFPYRSDKNHIKNRSLTPNTTEKDDRPQMILTKTKSNKGDD